MCIMQMMMYNVFSFSFSLRMKSNETASALILRIIKLCQITVIFSVAKLNQQTKRNDFNSML